MIKNFKKDCCLAGMLSYRINNALNSFNRLTNPR